MPTVTIRKAPSIAYALLASQVTVNSAQILMNVHPMLPTFVTSMLYVKITSVHTNVIVFQGQPEMEPRVMTSMNVQPEVTFVIQTLLVTTISEVIRVSVAKVTKGMEPIVVTSMNARGMIISVVRMRSVSTRLVTIRANVYQGLLVMVERVVILMNVILKHKMIVTTTRLVLMVLETTPVNVYMVTVATVSSVETLMNALRMCTIVINLLDVPIHMVRLTVFVERVIEVTAQLVRT